MTLRRQLLYLLAMVSYLAKRFRIELNLIVLETTVLTITLPPYEILVPQEGLEPSTISLQWSYSSQLELLWHIWRKI